MGASQVADEIYSAFRGRRMRVSAIYDILAKDNADRHRIKEALLLLEQQGRLRVDKPWVSRIRLGTITLAEDREVRFLE